MKQKEKIISHQSSVSVPDRKGENTVSPLNVGGNSSLVPVTGMYFFHPASFAEHQRAKRRPARFFPSEKRGVDHLGSITMVTDGRGNVVTNSSGKSHISYKPYGEILRTDSGGPDISKFKYTGQEEDKESSLLYYKARYYDPVIGRFLQADSVAFPERVMGMNRYMYVEGNPVMYGDDSGHKLSTAQGWALMGMLLVTVGPFKNASESVKKGVVLTSAIFGTVYQNYEEDRNLKTGLSENPIKYFGIDLAFKTDRKLHNAAIYGAVAYAVTGDVGMFVAGYMLGTSKDLRRKAKRENRIDFLGRLDDSIILDKAKFDFDSKKAVKYREQADKIEEYLLCEFFNASYHKEKLGANPRCFVVD